MAVIPNNPNEPLVALNGADVPPSTPFNFRANVNARMSNVEDKAQRAAGIAEALAKAISPNGSIAGGTITIGTGLSVNIAAGSAMVSSFVKWDATQTVGGLLAGQTNWLWLRQDGSFTPTGTNTPPTLADGHGDSLLWGTATAGASSVSSVDNTRASWSVAGATGVYISTLHASPTDATLHDAYAPAGGVHVTPTDRTSWNGAATSAASLLGRVLSATLPLRIDGGASADLSANRTLSLSGSGASTGDVMTWGGTAWGPAAVGSGGADTKKVKNGATDTTEGWLSDKLAAGSGLIWDTVNAGGNEQRRLSLNSAVGFSGTLTNPASITYVNGQATGGTSGSGTGTVTQINTGAHLSGGPITSSGTVAMLPSGATRGQFWDPVVTLDEYGVVTANQQKNVVTALADYTVSPYDVVILCDTTGGSFTVTLPDPATGLVSQMVYVKNTVINGNAITVVCAGGHNVEGAASFVIGCAARYSYTFVVNAGVSGVWWII